MLWPFSRRKERRGASEQNKLNCCSPLLWPFLRWKEERGACRTVSLIIVALRCCGHFQSGNTVECGRVACPKLDCPGRELIRQNKEDCCQVCGREYLHYIILLYIHSLSPGCLFLNKVVETVSLRRRCRFCEIFFSFRDLFLCAKSPLNDELFLSLRNLLLC